MKKGNSGISETNVFSSIHLLGDAEENFYQLGLKDCELGKKLHNDTLSLIKTNSKNVDKLIKIGAKEFLARTIFKNPNHYPLLKAYAEGLKINFHDLALIMMVPELMSTLPLWSNESIKKLGASFAPKLMGCSSLFFRDSNSEMNHYRILDFPLKGTYDTQERGILYEIKNWPKIYSINSVGIPYPSITLLTDNGVSIALHQKFSKVMNPKGMPIFEYVLEFARNVKNKNEALEFAKAHQTFTTWCLNVGFHNGEVLSIDVAGDQVNYLSSCIDDPHTPFIYFNNELLNADISKDDLLPYGLGTYNQMRKEAAFFKIEMLKELNKTNELNSLTATAILSSPIHNFYKKLPSTKDWKMDIITPSSLQVLNINLSKESIYSIAGLAPKIYRKNIFCISNIFKNPTNIFTPVKSNKLKNEDHEYNQALEEIITAQRALDNYEYGNCYHHLQMACDYMSESQIPKARHIIQFFFIVLQILNEEHPKIRKYLRDELHALKNKLPTYFEDHRLLFIARINRLLGEVIDLEEDQITNIGLKNVYTIEMKIPKALYFRSLKQMTVIRLDIMDIIYLYTSL